MRRVPPLTTAKLAMPRFCSRITRALVPHARAEAAGRETERRERSLAGKREGGGEREKAPHRGACVRAELL
jgi:hypothetical protein